MSNHNKSSVRQHRVNEQMFRILMVIFKQGLQDESLVSLFVTGVRVSSDMSRAQVFVCSNDSPGKDNINKLLKRLDKASAFIRKQVGQELHLARVPRLVFQYDVAVENTNRIDQLLKDLPS